MPVNNKWNISELRESIEYYYRLTKIPITYEYILFEGMNDSMEDVKRLARYVRSVPSKVNIIPFHDISFTLPQGFAANLVPADIGRIEKFVGQLRNEGVNAFVRTSSGFDIDAACGQLAFSKRN
jgi:23S rRNA (adenine2503-C2)-methyltransferase